MMSYLYHYPKMTHPHRSPLDKIITKNCHRGQKIAMNHLYFLYFECNHVLTLISWKTYIICTSISSSQSIIPGYCKHKLTFNFQFQKNTFHSYQSALTNIKLRFIKSWRKLHNELCNIHCLVLQRRALALSVAFLVLMLTGYTVPRPFSLQSTNQNHPQE
jgi:hypothetical protein